MKSINLIAAFALTTVQGVFAATYYVDVGNSNVGDGSQGNPWKSLATACSSVPANAGHVIKIGAGTFNEGGLSIPGGTTVIGAGANNTIIKSSTRPVVSIAGKSNVTVQDLGIDGEDVSTLLLDINNSSTIKVYRVNLKDGNQSGCFVEVCTDVTIDGGYYYHAGGSGTVEGDASVLTVQKTRGGLIQNLVIEEDKAEAIRSYGYMENVTFTRNICKVGAISTWNGGGSGMLCLEFWGTVNMKNCEVSYSYFNNTISLVQNQPTTSFRFHHNVVESQNYGIEMEFDNSEFDHNCINGNTYGCGYPLAFFGTSTHQNRKFHHNVLYNVGSVSLLMHYTGGVNGEYFYNNTFYSNKSSQFSRYNWVANGLTNSEFANNIFISTQGYGFDGQGASVNNNLFQYTPATGGASVSGDPLFVGIGNGSDVTGFALQSGSPAIDRGKVISGITDGYVGNAPDIGAFEYGVTPWTAGPGATSNNNPPIPSAPVAAITVNKTSGPFPLTVNFDASTSVGDSLTYAWDLGNGQKSATKTASTTYAIAGVFTVSLVVSNTHGTDTARISIRVTDPSQQADSIMLEAEDFSAMSGITNKGTVIGNCDNGTWVRFDNVDFARGFTTFVARVAVDPGHASQKVEVRSASLTGTLLGTMTVQSTGSWTTFQEQSVAITPLTGVTTLFIVFVADGVDGKGVGDFDWFKFVDRPQATASLVRSVIPVGRATVSFQNGVLKIAPVEIDRTFELISLSGACLFRASIPAGKGLVTDRLHYSPGVRLARILTLTGTYQHLLLPR